MAAGPNIATKPPNLFVRRAQPGGAPACFRAWHPVDGTHAGPAVLCFRCTLGQSTCRGGCLVSQRREKPNGRSQASFDRNEGQSARLQPAQFTGRIEKATRSAHRACRRCRWPRPSMRDWQYLGGRGRKELGGVGLICVVGRSDTRTETHHPAPSGCGKLTNDALA
jgi:hypothetical protein